MCIKIQDNYYMLLHQNLITQLMARDFDSANWETEKLQFIWERLLYSIL